MWSHAERPTSRCRRQPPEMSKNVKQLDRVVIRIAGDSGDGMQLTGDRFTQETAVFGNDLSTLPNFPAEIRAPQGTLAGVSSFQLHFADHDILTPGDRPDVLVAMNPAALKANLERRAAGRHDHRRHPRLHHRARWPGSAGPATRSRTARWTAHQVHAVDLTQLTLDALAGTDAVAQGRRPQQEHVRARTAVVDVLAPGRGDAQLPTAEVRQQAGHRRREHHRVPARAGTSARRPRRSPSPTRSSRRSLPTGTYRNITGNLALSYGLIAAAKRSRLPLFLGAYPITPASDILHELSKHKRFGVRTFQAEDEIAGIGAALGAAFGGALAVTTSSGPGIALKGETIGLAVSLELPLIICDIQRGGPSTGLPTKTEQSDLLQAMYGRNGEAPVPIVAPQSPGGLLRRDHRGRAHRADATARRCSCSPTATSPTAPSRGGCRRSPTCPTSPSSSRPSRTAPATRRACSCRTCATRRRWPVRGRSPARPVWSTGSVASRRPTAPATSATTRTTTTSWCAPGRPRSTASHAGSRR